MFVTGAEVEKQYRSVESLATPQKSKGTIEADFDISPCGMRLMSFAIKHCPQRLSTLQLARRVYMLGEGMWLVSQGRLIDGTDFSVLLVNDSSKNERLNDALSLLRNDEAINLSLVCSETINEIQTLGCRYTNIVKFSFECELIRSCGWVHFEKDLGSLTIIEAVTCPPACGEKPSRNIQVINVVENMESPGRIDIRSTVHKYYPVTAIDVAVAASHGGANVVVLPNLTKCVLTGPASVANLPPDIQSIESIKKYWWQNHAYKLSDQSVRDFVKITFNGSNHLTYPVSCTWKHVSCYVPNYTTMYRNVMDTRIISAVEWVRGTWRFTGGFQYCYDNSINPKRRDTNDTVSSNPPKRCRK